MAIKLGKNFDKSKVVKNLVRGFKLTPHIDRFLPLWNEQGFSYESQRKVPDDAWHPSGDCTPSLNALYHRALAHDPKAVVKHAPATVKNFQVGHFWHQFLQWIVVEKLQFASWNEVERRGSRMWGNAIEPIVPENWPGVHYEDGVPYYRKEDLYWIRYPEQQIRNEKGKVVDHHEHFGAGWPVNKLGNGLIRPQSWHWVTGSADIAKCSIPEHGEYLIDFKTMNSIHYKQSEGALLPILADKWECQVNVYMDFFDMERAIIVGINKDAGHALQEFEFKRNQPLIDALYDKWKLVSDCLDDKHEPPEELHYPLPFKGTST